MMRQVLLLVSAVTVCFAMPGMKHMLQKQGRRYDDQFFSSGVPEPTDGGLDETEVQAPGALERFRAAQQKQGKMYSVAADDELFSSGAPESTDGVLDEPADLAPPMNRYQTAQLRRLQMHSSPVFQRQRFQTSKQFSSATAAQQEPSAYAFLYNTQLQDGGTSYRHESGDGKGKVVGSYTMSIPDGRYRKVDYVADEGGFRAIVNTNEMGTREESPADVQLFSTAN